MNIDQLISISNSLDKIDSGNATPRMHGRLGSFLRHYTSCRNDFAKLAIEQNIGANLNGEISGDNIGAVSLVPLSSLAPPKAVSTRYGGFFSYPVLCPELLCVTDLRLWSSSGGGASGLNMIETLMEDEIGVTLTGGYRWLPPNRILPGNARIEPLKRTSNLEWAKMDFLKYSGEDVLSDPYPLEYRPLWTKSEPLFASVRVGGGLVIGDGSVIFPHAMSTDSSKIQPKLASCSTDRARESLAHEGLISCLLFKEPTDQGWTIWDSVEISPNELLFHLISWAELIDDLRADAIWEERAEIVEGCRNSLSFLGIETTSLGYYEASDSVKYPFAKSLAGRIRLSNGVGLGQVGPIP